MAAATGAISEEARVLARVVAALRCRGGSAAISALSSKAPRRLQRRLTQHPRLFDVYLPDSISTTEAIPAQVHVRLRGAELERAATQKRDSQAAKQSRRSLRGRRTTVHMGTVTVIDVEDVEEQPQDGTRFRRRAANTSQKEKRTNCFAAGQSLNLEIDCVILSDDEGSQPIDTISNDAVHSRHCSMAQAAANPTYCCDSDSGGSSGDADAADLLADAFADSAGNWRCGRL